MEWISIDDRKPDFGVRVLVCFNDTVVDVSVLSKGQDEDYFECDEPPYLHVTHWMPLPKPPKGEQDE